MNIRDNDPRKQIFIICSKEEYSMLEQYLIDIFNPKASKIIAPFQFIEWQKIDKIIEALAAKEMINEDGSIDRYNSIKNRLLKEWYDNKLNYFVEYAKDADEIVMLSRSGLAIEHDSLQEELKEAEIATKVFGKKPIGIDIKSIIDNNKINKR